MSNISSWSTTAASNNAAPPNGAPEGQSPSTINDCIRENMASVSKFYKDTQGTLTSTGSSNAYVLATNSAHASLAVQGLIVFIANHTNTGASTIAVDGLAAKNIYLKGAALRSGAILSGKTYIVTYNSSAGVYDLIGGAGLTSADAGAKILIASATASNDSAITFASGIDSTYDEYVIELLNVIPATGATSLRMRTSANAGSTYDSSATDYSLNYNVFGAAAFAGGVQNNAISYIQATAADIGSSANELGVCATVSLIRPSESTYTNVRFNGSYTTNAAAVIASFLGGGTRNSAAAVDAIQFYFSSGNVESGIFHLYGIRKQ